MALENSLFPSRPDSLSLPVEDQGDGKEAQVSTGVYNVSEELGHVVTTETAPSPPPSAKVNRSFQAKLAEREAKANQPRKKTQGPEKERGRFGWGELGLDPGSRIQDQALLKASGRNTVEGCDK